MNEEYRKKLMPAELNWLIINNLEKFNDKPALIEELYKKIQNLIDHPILGTFVDYYKEIYDNYFNSHNCFPDMAWLDANFKKSKPLKILDDPFSMSIYEDLIKIIDKELLKREVVNTFVDNEASSMEDIRSLSVKLASFSSSNTEIPVVTKDSILNMYPEYKKNYKGVKTHIEALDRVIGNLGYKSISVFGAVSGHGKSTIAISAAYNAAVYSGLCVDYISYELAKEQMWFNLGSIESSIQCTNVEACKIKDATLTEEEEAELRRCTQLMLDKLDNSGGFINVIDQTAMHINTFEELLAKLEDIAEKRGRKADLIVVDNVDNFRVLKNSERDESAKVNNFITGLDAFSKTYYNGEGVAILLLSQVNRGAMKRLQDTEKSEDTKVVIDVTCFQKYNALYEKASCALIGYADAQMRSVGRMNIFPVKLRNRPIPVDPIQVPAKFAYSRIGGDMELPDTSISKLNEQIRNRMANQSTSVDDVEAQLNELTSDDEEGLFNTED